jgi:thiamine-phosphate pyrophosphorylase
MTDPRADAWLMAAAARLPRGAGIILRHGHLAEGERRLLGTALLRVARRRGLWLLAVDPPPGLAVDGVHLTSRHRRRPWQRGRRAVVTAAAHDMRDGARARRLGAQVLLVSPVFETRSHPGVRPLGPLRLAALARALPLPVMAMGGMDARRLRRLRPLGAEGLAGIDCWRPPEAADQKASAPPI